MAAGLPVVCLGIVAAGTGAGGVRASCRSPAVWNRSGYESSMGGVLAGFEDRQGRLVLPGQPRLSSVKEASLR
jgi:hypothetical protein